MNDQERLELDLWIERVIFKREWELHQKVRINGTWRVIPTYLLKTDDPSDPTSGQTAGSRPYRHSSDNNLAIELLAVIASKYRISVTSLVGSGVWSFVEMESQAHVISASFSEAVAQLAKAVFS